MNRRISKTHGWLKILALLGGIITALGALTIFPATIRYLIRSSGDFVAIVPLLLRILLLGFAGIASLEAILFGLLAYLEVNHRRQRIILAIFCVGLALVSLFLIPCLKLPIMGLKFVLDGQSDCIG